MAEKDKGILCWHFAGGTLRDGRPLPADGEVLRHDDKLVVCESGLHASVRIVDALRYAPGNTICRVRLWGGEAQGHDDKLVGHSRKILWRVDGERLLRKFACDRALDVAHLWDMPPIVRQYLETQDETKRDAARVAARGAAWHAARAAARNAAWHAARVGAEAAAEAAAWAAARDAAWAAAEAAADAAAEAAARNAAWNAARVAARNAAGNAHNKRLTAMVMAAHEEEVDNA